MRCPYCREIADRVIDSRLADDGDAIRRRRECRECGRRYTTFERLESVSLVVVKRSGERQPFKRSKVIAGVQSAAKNRPIDDETIGRVGAEIEEQLRLAGPVVTSEEVGLAVLDRLKALDSVAYVRFASVYKEFEDATDFTREVTLLNKTTVPKNIPQKH